MTDETFGSGTKSQPDEKMFTVVFRYIRSNQSYPILARNEEEAKNLCYSAFGLENIKVVKVEPTEEVNIKESKIYKRAIKMNATPEELQKVADYVEENLKKSGD